MHRRLETGRCAVRRATTWSCPSPHVSQVCATFASISWPRKTECRAVYLAMLRQERHCVERRTRTVFDQGHQATSEVRSRELSRTEAWQAPSQRLRPSVLISGVSAHSREQTSAGSYRLSQPSPRCTWSDVSMILIDHSLGVGHPHLSVPRVQEAHLLQKAMVLLPEFVGSVSKHSIRILLRLLNLSYHESYTLLWVVRVCLARSSCRVCVVVKGVFGVCLTRLAHSSMQ